jgi:hypothetical protein
VACEQVEAAVCPEGGDPAGFGDVVGSGETVHVQNCVSQTGHDLWGGAGVHGGAASAKVGQRVAAVSCEVTCLDKVSPQLI